MIAAVLGSKQAVKTMLHKQQFRPDVHDLWALKARCLMCLTGPLDIFSPRRRGEHRLYCDLCDITASVGEREMIVARIAMQYREVKRKFPLFEEILSPA